MAQVDFLAASEGRLNQDAFRIGSAVQGNWAEALLSQTSAPVIAYKSVFPPVVMSFAGGSDNGYSDADDLAVLAGGDWVGGSLPIEVAAYSAYRFIGDYRGGSPSANRPSYFWG